MKSSVYLIVHTRMPEGNVVVERFERKSNFPIVFRDVDVRCGRGGYPDQLKFQQACRELAIRLMDQAEKKDLEITNLSLHLENRTGHYCWGLPQDIRFLYYDRRVERQKLNPPNVIRLDKGTPTSPDHPRWIQTNPKVRVSVTARSNVDKTDSIKVLFTDIGDRSFHLDGLNFKPIKVRLVKDREKNRVSLTKAAIQLHRRLAADLEPRGYLVENISIEIPDYVILRRNAETEVFYGKDKLIK